MRAFKMHHGSFLSVLCALSLFACTHDLDKLKEGQEGSAGSGSSGSGTSGSGGDTDSGTAGTSGSDADAGVDAGGGTDSCGTCEPPEPIGMGSFMVTPEACCYGAGKTECGVGFAGTSKCYATEVPGATDTTCPDLERGSLMFPGCCRADAQCGVVIEAFGLGCVARTDVPKALGGPLTARTCISKCDSDSDCSDFADDLVCVESNTHQADARFCARSCQRDADCMALSGTLCALFDNQTERRYDQFCRKPIGSGDQDEPCNSADDCRHGTCAFNKTTNKQYCTQLCGGELDCPAENQSCSPTNIPTPVDELPQQVRICAQTQ